MYNNFSGREGSLMGALHALIALPGPRHCKWPFVNSPLMIVIRYVTV